MRPRKKRQKTMKTFSQPEVGLIARWRKITHTPKIVIHNESVSHFTASVLNFKQHKHNYELSYHCQRKFDTTTSNDRKNNDHDGNADDDDDDDR